MFVQACKNNREAIYGVWGFTKFPNNQQNNGTGSGFTIAPGKLITCAHLVHVESNVNKPVHENFFVIRSPDIGQPFEVAKFVAEDKVHDIALLEITSPRSIKYLTLEPNVVPTGTPCGSLGFPLGQIIQTPQGLMYALNERFQGSFISSYVKSFKDAGGVIDSDFYETDTLMYSGSSGCPGFTADSTVIGMQSRSLLAGAPPKNVKKQKQKQNGVQVPSNLLSISMWVPSPEIIKFTQENGVAINGGGTTP